MDEDHDRLIPPRLDSPESASVGHIDNHAIVNQFINDLDECDICHALVRAPQTDAHYRAHVGRAIAAR